MPCYTVQTASVNLNKADRKLLAKALERLGYSVQQTNGQLVFSNSKTGVRGNYSNNKITLTSNNGTPNADEIKIAYSEQIIRAKAEEYAEQGWEMTQDGDEWVFNHSSGYGADYA